MTAKSLSHTCSDLELFIFWQLAFKIIHTILLTLKRAHYFTYKRVIYMLIQSNNDVLWNYLFRERDTART